MLPEDPTLSTSFECPDKDTGLTLAPTDLGTFRILINGKLEGKDITNMEENTTETKRWKTDSFCVAFLNFAEYFDSGEENATSSETSVDPFSGFDFTFMTCHEETLTWC